MMEQNMNMPGGMCSCPHHKIVPLSITLIGLSFLLGDLSILTWGAVGLIWPILLIVIGVVKMSKGMCKCCKK